MSFTQSLTANTQHVLYDVSYDNVNANTINGNPVPSVGIIANSDVPIRNPIGGVPFFTDSGISILNAADAIPGATGRIIDLDVLNPETNLVMSFEYAGDRSMGLVGNQDDSLPTNVIIQNNTTDKGYDIRLYNFSEDGAIKIHSNNGGQIECQAEGDFTVNSNGHIVITTSNNIDSTTIAETSFTANQFTVSSTQDINLTAGTTLGLSIAANSGTAGDVLTANGDTTCSWLPPTGGGGGSGYPQSLYVSKLIGSDATGDGTLSKPFATFGRALFGIIDSTTIYGIDSQTYDENLVIINNNINIYAPFAILAPTTGTYSVSLNINSPTSINFATFAGTANLVQIATYGNLFIKCREFYSNINCNSGGYLNIDSSIVGATVTWNAGGGFIYGFVGLNVSPGDITLSGSVQVLQSSGVLMS